MTNLRNTKRTARETKAIMAGISTKILVFWPWSPLSRWLWRIGQVFDSMVAVRRSTYWISERLLVSFDRETPRADRAARGILVLG